MSIDPSSLSLPSPRASPAPSSSVDTPQPAPPPRKRARTDLSPEDRKEARANRNRIAAQNSRDKRKAQFTYLERRVAELEEENRRLRAGLASMTAPTIVDASAARDKENEELRERIRTLEKGWDAVVKALAAQGLPTGIPTPQTTSSPASPPPPLDDSSSTSNSTTAFPVLVPPPTLFPISPTPSHSSSSGPSIFDEFDTGGEHRVSCTGVPAAGGLATTTSQSTLDISCPSELQSPPSSPVIDDVAMEELLREILEPSPAMPSTPLPPDTPSAQVTRSPALAPTTTPMTSPPNVDWMDADEMQRMLDILPAAQTDIPRMSGDEAFDFPSALDLDLGVSGWEVDTWISSSSEISVF